MAAAAPRPRSFPFTGAVGSALAPSAKRLTASASRGGALLGAGGAWCSVHPACQVASPTAWPPHKAGLDTVTVELTDTATDGELTGR
eukprot:3911019-Pyramimonas_sp.AAC.1